jgi:hypothetical protein
MSPAGLEAIQRSVWEWFRGGIQSRLAELDTLPGDLGPHMHAVAQAAVTTEEIAELHQIVLQGAADWLVRAGGGLTRATVKRAQGLRATAVEWDREVLKEVGDIALCLLIMCSEEGVLLSDAISARFQVVMGRSLSESRPVG